jgi:hypothetical protein
VNKTNVYAMKKAVLLPILFVVEFGSPAAANKGFLSFRIRGKNLASTRWAMEEICSVINPGRRGGVGDLAASNSHSYAIRMALLERGYIERQNIATEYQYAERPG